MSFIFVVFYTFLGFFVFFKSFWVFSGCFYVSEVSLCLFVVIFCVFTVILCLFWLLCVSLWSFYVSVGFSRPGKVIEMVKSLKVLENSWNFIVRNEIICYSNLSGITFHVMYHNLFSAS